MVERAPDLDRIFAALADPTRRAILERLRTAPATLTELSGPFSMSFNAISKHVMVLERAGLLRRQVAGRKHRCILRARPLAEADRWLHHYREFWTTRLDVLERHLIASKKKRSWPIP